MSEIRKALSLSDEDYEEALDICGGRCFICGHPEPTEGRRLAVDHDHKINAIRGLLCTACNRRLGATRNREWLLRAAAYLDNFDTHFADQCERCETVMIGEHRRDGLFFYRCSSCGHVWKCSWKTAGYPASWDFGGQPTPPPPMRFAATEVHISQRDELRDERGWVRRDQEAAE